MSFGVFSAIESAHREDKTAELFCKILAGDSVLDHSSCKGTQKVNVKVITSETNSRTNRSTITF